MIYLDNAATTKIDEAVLGAMQPYLGDFYGNMGSLHSKGREAHNAVKNARKQVADFINASPEQIIFTSGGTEANNMVINNAMLMPCKSRIVTSKAEHESILKSVKNAANYGKMETWVLPVLSSGSLDLDHAVDAILNKTNAQSIAVASFMRANNELGSLNPIWEIGELCSELYIPFHTDCVQAAGFSEIDVKKFKCDYLTISSHKIHGPKGVGALYVKEPKMFKPLIHGGDSQEFGLRGGTENVAGIVGFGKACEIAMNNMAENQYKIRESRDAFKSNLRFNMACLGLSDILHFNSIANKIINVRFDGIPSESLLMALDSQGVCVSAGSACNASDGKPSHVLKAIGLTDEQAKSSIRVSFSKYNTAAESIEAAKIFANCVKTLYNIHVS